MVTIINSSRSCLHAFYRVNLFLPSIFTFVTHILPPISNLCQYYTPKYELCVKICLIIFSCVPDFTLLNSNSDWNISFLFEKRHPMGFLDLIIIKENNRQYNGMTIWILLLPLWVHCPPEISNYSKGKGHMQMFSPHQAVKTALATRHLGKDLEIVEETLVGASPDAV